jgi:hypothetical protein
VGNAVERTLRAERRTLSYASELFRQLTYPERIAFVRRSVAGHTRAQVEGSLCASGMAEDKVQAFIALVCPEEACRAE